MAKITNVTKTAGYRRCVILPKQRQNLQQLVNAALLNLQTAEARTEPLDAQSTAVRVIGKHNTVNNILCGYLSTWERGKSQPVITDDPQARSLSLGAVPPPQLAKGGKKQEYIPGVLYFAILENHLAIVQTAAMRGSSLEAHLAWLLKSRTSSLPATTSLVLSDDAQKATKERIRKSHVKSIAFGQPLMAEFVSATSVPRDKADDKATKEERKRFKPVGPFFELIKQYFDEERFEKLGLNDVFDGNLEVWIELRYPKRKRSPAGDTVKLMDNLGIGLRDIEGDQVTLQLADGHKVSGSELKISGTISVPGSSNGLPDEDKAWEALADWLAGQIRNGVVDPD
jgi:hypothetical protein